MKIAFNMVSVEDINTVTGVGQHQLNIVKGLMELSYEDNYLFLVNEIVDRQLKQMYPKIKTYNYGKQLKIPQFFKKFYYVINTFYLNQCVVPKIVKKVQPDIIFQPYNCITLKTKWKIPVAVMVLDMYHRFFPQCLTKKKYNFTVKRHNAIMKNSGLIVTSSQVNKKHIIQFYPKTKDKIKVAPVPIVIDTEDISEFPIKKPYILCVNSLRYHKNIHTLIKAFNLIKDNIKHDLVLIGTPEADEADNIKNKSNRIIFTGYISHQERNYLYSEADLVVSPTMFEGFGMTPLEAMLFEKRVLVSDIEIMRESTFNAAEYFTDIENETVLAERIEQILGQELDSKKLMSNKEQVNKRYSPSVVAKMINRMFVEFSGGDHK